MLLRALSVIHRSGKCKVWAEWQPGNKLPTVYRKLMFKFQDAQGMLLLHLLHLLSHAANVKRHHYCIRCNTFFSAGNEQTVNRWDKCLNCCREQKVSSVCIILPVNVQDKNKNAGNEKIRYLLTYTQLHTIQPQST